MEVYDSDFILNSLREYIQEQEDCTFDGFEIIFPDGLNTIDPLLLIRYASLEASFDEQVTLTKLLIAAKKVQIKYFDKQVGEFSLSTPEGSFMGFSVFETYPLALKQLIRTCWLGSLKNLIPPLDDSQLAAKKRLQERKRLQQEEFLKVKAKEPPK